MPTTVPPSPYYRTRTTSETAIPYSCIPVPVRVGQECITPVTLFPNSRTRTASKMGKPYYCVPIHKYIVSEMATAAKVSIYCHNFKMFNINCDAHRALDDFLRNRILPCFSIIFLEFHSRYLHNYNFNFDQN